VAGDHDIDELPVGGRSARGGETQAFHAAWGVPNES